jgi:hypothetical protein
MSANLVIARRFCGPPDSGNGGYVCGRIARYVDGPAEITLRRPPPLATPMTVEPIDDGLVCVRHGDTVVAEGRRSPQNLPIAAPSPISLADARLAGAGSRLRTHPEASPFPTCFACGPDRRQGDGLRIQVGPVAGRDLAADVWYPDTTLAGPDGNVQPEFLWAALDCAGGVGALASAAPTDLAHVLGRLAVRQVGPVRPDKPYVVVGWRVADDGRKLTAGSAVFDGDGLQVALGCATWIQLRAESAVRPTATASRPS